ncbi:MULTISPECIES: hypothetical protein [Rhodococcus erythropolis group]|uniref:Uncharacterized protein n=1 Tax=Rhodococcus erythropolis TaxID=1833 RepID=A0A8I0ZQ06_RHOER|nr:MULTISPECIES: hypothetical protein [Rhodococcus erythropolis group]MBH5143629.1 hypothetical protein [Rhodococcus erythropolis]MCQ4150515.1 hypothetical protein [Rhodococcus qingshengii]
MSGNLAAAGLAHAKRLPHGRFRGHHANADNVLADASALLTELCDGS